MNRVVKLILGSLVYMFLVLSNFFGFMFSWAYIGGNTYSSSYLYIFCLGLFVGMMYFSYLYFNLYQDKEV